MEKKKTRLRSSELAEHLRDLDLRLRRGDVAGVARAIRGLPKKHLSLEDRVQTANLLRRLGAFIPAGRLIARWVYRESGVIDSQAPPEALIEYGAALANLGAAREAHRILSQPAVAHSARALMFASFADMAEWNYPAALVKLREACSLPFSDEYTAEIALANKIAAEIALGESNDRLESEMKDLAARLGKQANKTLRIRLQILEMQFFVNRQQIRTALKTGLALRENLDPKSDPYVLCSKWIAIARGFNQNRSEIKAGFSQVRELARQTSSYEVHRDLDLWQAWLTKDSLLLLSTVYHASPFESYRRQIESDSKTRGVSLLSEQTMLSRATNKSDKDLVKAKPALIHVPTGVDLMSGRGIFAKESILKNLFIIIASDFYKPFHMAPLFERLYPESRFNFESSPALVWEHIQRLRRHFQQRKLGLKVICENQSFYLAGAPGIRLISDLRPLNWTDLVALEEDEKILKVLARYPEAKLSVSQIRKAMSGLSVSSAHRWLERALQKKWLLRNGAARATRYGLNYKFNSLTSILDSRSLQAIETL